MKFIVNEKTYNKLKELGYDNIIKSEKVKMTKVYLESTTMWGPTPLPSMAWWNGNDPMKQSLRPEVYEDVPQEVLDEYCAIKRRLKDYLFPIFEEAYKKKEARMKIINEQEKEEAIKEARIYFKYRWPTELYSGIMFFKGYRITQVEFEA